MSSIVVAVAVATELPASPLPPSPALSPLGTALVSLRCGSPNPSAPRFRSRRKLRRNVDRAVPPEGPVARKEKRRNIELLRPKEELLPASLPLWLSSFATSESVSSGFVFASFSAPRTVPKSETLAERRRVRGGEINDALRCEPMCCLKPNVPTFLTARVLRSA